MWVKIRSRWDKDKRSQKMCPYQNLSTKPFHKNISLRRLDGKAQGMMIRALSTRKVRGSYKKLGDEEKEAGAGLLEVKPSSVPVNHPGQSPKVNKPVEETGGSVHPLFSFFNMSLKRKEKKTKKKNTTTAKPEFARYLEYVKEGGVWDNTLNEPVIYYRIMPTFSVANLDRSLKSGASKSREIQSTLHLKPPSSNPENDERKKLREKTFTHPQMSPSLYATPKEIPRPNSPSSYTPSPYIINHKSRGPVLLNKDSEVEDGTSHPITLGEEKIRGNVDVEATTPSKKSTSTAVDHTNGVHIQGIPERLIWDSSPPHGEYWNEKSGRDISNGGTGNHSAANTLQWKSYLLEPVRIKASKELESENFYNTEVEDVEGEESSHKLATPVGEFYDASDELSTDSGVQSSVNHIETDLREMRLGLLVEIERRRQAEEALEQMQVHWRRLREQLAHVGLFLPLDPTSSPYSMNLADELHCQLVVTRFVSDSLGSDLAKAEVEMEMEAELASQNFEITRLSDRLHYYETVNQEMCQRNQEAKEMARRDEQRRKRRQRWIPVSIAASLQPSHSEVESWLGRTFLLEC